MLIVFSIKQKCTIFVLYLEWHLYFQNDLEEEHQTDESEIPDDLQLHQLLTKEFACLNLI